MEKNSLLGGFSGYASSRSASNSPSGGSCGSSNLRLASHPAASAVPRSHSSCSSSEGSFASSPSVGSVAIDPFASAGESTSAFASQRHELSPQQQQQQQQQQEHDVDNDEFVVTFLKCEWDFDDKGKDVSRYYFSIKPPKTEGWIIVKKIREFIDLESCLKKSLTKADYEKYGKIGDKGVLTGASPSSRSLKKTALEFYLTHLLSRSPLHSSVVAFVSGSRVNEKDILHSGQSTHHSNYIKEGFLLKKGSFFTPWIVRYYRLKSMRLDYYQTKYGPVQGSIKLPSLTVFQYNADPDYRHAFILENKHQQFQVILCSENDTERDEWIYHIKNVIREASSSAQGFGVAAAANGEYPTSQIRSDAESIYYVATEDAPPTFPKEHKIPFSQKSLFSKVFGTSSNNNSNSHSTPKEEPAQFDDNRSILLDFASFPSNAASGGAKEHQQEDSTKIFGISLKHAVINSGEPYSSMHIPRIVQQCIDYLEEQEAFLEEGIYRLSGSSSSIKNLRERCDADPHSFFLAAHSPDIHVVSGLLKLYLRELPQNIICQSIDNFDSSSSTLEQQSDAVQTIVHALPQENQATLKFLFAHLKNVVDNCAKNKMTVKNIAIVFSATLSVPSWMFLALLNGANEGKLFE